MDYFVGATPEERWKNDMLKEQRETNRLLREMFDRNAQAAEPIAEAVRTPGRRGRRKAVNQ